MDRDELLSSLLTASRAADENLLSALTTTPDSLYFSGKSLDLDTSYIGEIEKGLMFVESAIGEQRRFIRSDGEVLPIEKIKRASKESIVHLARHAEFVSKQNEQIVPEKLYSVERLNDYATYENRFLYSLLMLVKEFLDERYAFITKNDLSRIALIMDKKVIVSGRSLSVKLEVTHEGCVGSTQELLSKIEELRARTEFYLRTPLMEEASKEERIRTLVKTNVLKMDKNFVECTALYEFLLSYQHKDGKADVDQTVNLGEKSAGLINAAVLLLDEGITAASEGDLYNTCLNASEASFNRQKEKLGGRGEEYIALLESRISALQADVSQLKGEANRANELTKLNAELTEKLDEANEQAAKNRASQAELSKRWNGERAKLICEYNDKVEKLGGELERLNSELEELKRQNTLLSARVNALRFNNGEVSDGEFRSKEGIDELEREFESLGRLLYAEWKGVKSELKRVHRNEIKGIVSGAGKGKKAKEEKIDE